MDCPITAILISPRLLRNPSVEKNLVDNNDGLGILAGKQLLRLIELRPAGKEGLTLALEARSLRRGALFLELVQRALLKLWRSPNRDRSPGADI